MPGIVVADAAAHHPSKEESAQGKRTMPTARAY